jgi:hypothetical protein
MPTSRRLAAVGVQGPGEETARLAELDELVRFLRREVLVRLERPAALLLVGSHAEGNANAASDVDLIAVTTRRRRGGRIRKESLDVQGRAIVVKHVGADQLRRRIGTLDLIYRHGRQSVDSLATRIAEAVVVHDTDGIGRSLVAEARRYQPSAGTLREFARASMTYYQDVLGSIDNHEPETAILMARTAATFAVDCLLLQRGFRSLKPKWHLRRLRRAEAPSVMARYRRVLGLDQDTAELQARQAFAELDQLLCEVLQIDSIEHFEQSPLWNRPIQPRRSARGVDTLQAD